MVIDKAKKKRIDYLNKQQQKLPDPFNLYALAIELKEIDVKKTSRLFNELLNIHPDYCPTYFHAADFFATQGDFTKAESIYKKGIETIGKTKDGHALMELKNAYQNFLFDC